MKYTAPSSGVVLAAEAVAGQADTVIEPLGIAAGRMWGMARANAQQLYVRSAGAASWTKVGNTTTRSVLYVYPLASGVVLYCSSSNPELHRLVYDAGTNQVADTKVLDLQATARGFYYSAAEHGGIIIFGEYGEDGTKLYKSVDDGENWAEVHDFTAAAIRHIHGVTYHAGLGVWVCATGDGTGQRFLSKSDAAGENWTDIVATYWTVQHVNLLDYGHATRLAIASDSAMFVPLVDLTDGSLVFTRGLYDQRNNAGFQWDLFYHGGVYYAAQYNSGTADRNSVVWVSTDLTDWVVYHRLGDAARGVFFVGVFDGYLHARIREGSTYNHLRLPVLSAGDLRTVSPTRVDPAATNLYNSSALSSCESLDGWAKGIGNYEYTTDEHLDGAGSIHFYAAGNQIPQCRTPLVTVTADGTKAYVATVRIKGTDNTNCKVQFMNGAGTAVGTLVSITPHPDAWQEVRVPAYLVPNAGNTQLRLNFRMDASDNQAESTHEVWIDCIQITELPGCGSWVDGAAARVASSIDSAKPVGTNWTETFMFWPGLLKEDLDAIDADYYVRTWRVSDTAYASLRWAVGDARWELVVTDGDNTEVLYSAAHHFQPEAQIRFTITCTAGVFSCTVANGQAAESMTLDGSAAVTANVYAALTGVTITRRYGDVAGANGMPGWIRSLTKGRVVGGPIF
jgi:hypothetical protein